MSSASKPVKPRLGVFKLASCDGCQLTFLDCEDELLTLAGAVEIVHFPEAASGLAAEGPFDLTLVEGSVSTPQQLEEIRHIRAVSKHLVTIGACATAGGIQALRNWADHEEYIRAVYASPEYIESLSKSTPVSLHVPVDFELRGCPIAKEQLLELMDSFLRGRKPQISDASVCMQCKRKGNVCVMVAKGMACLGPVTQDGCGALCPSFDRGCYGCFGPKEAPNARSLGDWFKAQGDSQGELQRRFRLFTGYREAFREESERHE